MDRRKLRRALYLNSFHETFKFIMDYSPTEINFLDVKVLKNDKNNQLETNTQNQWTQIKTSMQHLAALSSSKSRKGRKD